MNTMKGQTLTGTVKTPATVQQLLRVMLVVILRHVLMIFVVIQHRNMSGQRRKGIFAATPNHVILAIIIALDSIESISWNEVSKLLRSSFNLVSLFWVGFSDVIYDNIKFPF